MVFNPGAELPADEPFWLIWRSEKPDLAKAVSRYPALHSIANSEFGQPQQVSLFKPNQAGEFAGSSWWASKYPASR